MSEAEFIEVLGKIRDYEGQLDSLSKKLEPTPQDTDYMSHIYSKLPELKDRFSILITNPDVIRSSSDIIKLLEKITVQEDIYRQATEKFNSSGDQNDALRYTREKRKLDQLNYDFIQLMTAKKAMIRGGQAAKDLRDLYVKQVELNCAACEKARETLAGLDAGAGPAAASAASAAGAAGAAGAASAAAPAPAQKKGLFGFFRKGGGRRKTRRSKKSRSKRRQTRSRR